MIRTARPGLVLPGNPHSLPCVCRPSGWIAIWKRLGQLSVLDQGGLLSV